MSRFGFKHGLEDVVEKMARVHGVEHVREHFKAGRFEPQSAAVQKWLLWQDVKVVLLMGWKFAVGVAAVAGVIVSCVKQ